MKIMKTGKLICTVSLCALVMSGCQKLREPTIEAQKILEEFDGPKIDGVTDTILRTAKMAEARGEYEKAAKVYRQLLDREPDSQEFLLGYAEANRRAHEYERAIQAYNGLLQVNEDHIEAREGLGITHLSAGNFDDAGDELSAVMKQDKTRWRTLNALGLLFVHKEMYDEAIAYFSESLKQSPNNPSVLNNVGLTQSVRGEHDKAVEALEKASDLAANNSLLRKQVELNLAMVYGIHGDVEQAEEIAKEYLSGPALYNNLGLYSYLADNEVMAKSYLNMALTTSPRHYERAWKNLSQISKDSKGTQSKTYKGPGKRVKID
jgi:Flp pilus assembly protein TadD